MNESIDKQIKEGLYEITAYDEKLKEKIWANIQKEQDGVDRGVITVSGKRNRISKWLLIAVLSIICMGTTVLAKPILEGLIAYFGEAKLQSIYNHYEDSWVSAQTKIYKSQLGYMTYYDDTYFEVMQKGDVDYFVAKEHSDTYIAVWLEEGKDFETVLWEETKQKVTDLNPIFLDERAVEVEYQADPSGSGKMTVTLLGKADELGTFVLKMIYNEQDVVSGRMCHNLANEFIPLNKKNLEKLSQVKPQLVFDYDQSQYELVQYTSNPNSIYLQKKGVEQPDYETNVLFIYSYYFDQSVDEKLKEILDEQEQRRQFIMSMFEGREDEATGLTTMIEETSEMNIPSRKLIEVEDDTQALWRTTYLVDDGMGGCYEIYIYLPEHEDLEKIIDSIEMRQELPKNMEYRTVEDHTLG